MTTKHTPGPWAVDEDGTVVADSGAHVAVVSQADDFPCLEEDERPDAAAECHANGHLIAAAPDLYEVLEEVLAQHWIRHDMGTALLTKARAALATARGETP